MVTSIRSRKNNPGNVKKGKPNSFILAFTIGMLFFGTVMIFDASVYVASSTFDNEFYFLIQHLVWILIGLIPATLVYIWDYRKIAKLSVPLLAINILLLVAVLVVGDSINGSRRWFELGPIRIQPAEFIKPVFIVYLSSWLAKEKTSYKSFKDALRFGFGRKLAGFAFTLGITLLLVVLEPDLGTTMVVGIAAFAIFLVSGTDTAHMVGSFATGGVLVLIASIAAILAPYRLERVKTFIQLFLTGEVVDPNGSGYQIYQILIGIGAAGWKGVGFGQSRQRFGYLVENTAHTDSIFAVYLEELGLIGGLLLIGAWLTFFMVGKEVADNAPDRLGRLMGIGIVTWLSIQALLNMAANVGLIPLTGLPLPFFTYGGSNTIVTMVGAALLLNISRYNTGNGRKIR